MERSFKSDFIVILICNLNYIRSSNFNDPIAGSQLTACDFLLIV